VVFHASLQKYTVGPHIHSILVRSSPGSTQTPLWAMRLM
jgi:hypothetical protein